MVDSADARCGRCGQERPDTGWRPLGLPRLDAPAEPVVEDAFDFPTAPPGAFLVESPLDNVVAMPGTTPGVLRVKPVADDEPAMGAAPSPSPPASRRRPEPLRLRVWPAADDTPEPREAPADAGPRYYAGRYRIEEDLPAAPGTTRHLAVQEPAVRRVILTVLRRGRAAEAQQSLESRFLRDARVLARLRHPCLSHVHDVGRAADSTCFVTEEVPYGPTFRDLAETGSLPPERLLGIAANLASALATLHENGVVHRCVRADAVVVGLGVWRSGVGSELTQLGRYGLHVLPEEVGAADADSVLTWPPEVLAGQEPDESADIYAVGVLLYHALTRRPLHEGTADELRAAVARAPATALTRSADPLANRLCDVAERCLAPVPEQRYPSARALLRELEELARPPVVADARPAPSTTWSPALALAALVGALVPTFAFLATSAWRASDAPGPIVSPPDPPALVAPVPVRPPAAPPSSAITTGAAVPGAVPAEAPLAKAGAVAPSEPTGVVSAPAAAEASAPSGATDASADRALAAAPSEPRRSRRRSSPVATVAPSEPAPAPAAVAPEPPPAEPPAAAVAVAEPASPTPAPPASAPATTPAPSSASTVPGAAALSGLWLGKVPGGSLALDLTVAADGRVTGRARRSDRAGEGVVVGRVSRGEDGLRVELQVTDTSGTESYSGGVEDGALTGRIQAGGKPAGRFSARR